MTREECAEMVSKFCAWAVNTETVFGESPAKQFLKSTGRKATPEEIQELTDRVRSAALSELSSYTQIKPEESK